MTSNLEVGGSSPPGIAIYGGGCKTQEGLINPLAADYRSRPGALPGTPTNTESKMEKFELLLQCYLSGQMSERQWQDHLAYDEGLKEWYVNTLQKQ